MSWLPYQICSLASLLVIAPACSCAPELQVTGATAKVSADESPPSESAFFDGEELRLRAARGETLGLQVFVRETKTVSLSVPPEVAAVQAFHVDDVAVTEPSTAMYGESAGGGRYPDVLRPAESPLRVEREAFFDVAVSPNATPGVHVGTLQVGKRRFPVRVSVEKVAIDLRHEPLVWVFYLPKEIARVHGLPEDDSPALIETEARYHELFRQHGAFLAADPTPDRFAPRERFVHDVSYWPVAVDDTSDASITEDTRTWLAIFADRPEIPFAIPVDEPRTLEQKRRARHVAQVMGNAGAGPGKLLRGVTSAVDPELGDAFDLYFSPDNLPNPARQQRSEGIRFWTYNGRPPSAGSMIIDTPGTALRTWGWIAFLHDIDLWYAWEGLYFSDRYNGGGPTNVFEDPITFDERSAGGEDFGNGDGLLAYPGALPSLRLKAMRRGLQDRLLLLKLGECGGDREARTLARRVIPRSLGEASDEPSWPSEETAWEAARQQLFDAIEQRCTNAS